MGVSVPRSCHNLICCRWHLLHNSRQNIYRYWCAPRGEDSRRGNKHTQKKSKISCNIVCICMHPLGHTRVHTQFEKIRYHLFLPTSSTWGKKGREIWGKNSEWNIEFRGYVRGYEPPSSYRHHRFDTPITIIRHSRDGIEDNKEFCKSDTYRVHCGVT